MNVDENWGLIWKIVPSTSAAYGRDGEIATFEEIETDFIFFIDNLAFAANRREALERTKDEKLSEKALKKLWIGYRQLSMEELQLDWDKLPIPYPYYSKINTTIGYRGFMTSCSFIDENVAEWSTEGCRVSVCLPKPIRIGTNVNDWL